MLFSIGVCISKAQAQDSRGVGYAYHVGGDRLLGNDGVYHRVCHRSGIEFRTGFDFTWHRIQLVGVKRDTTLAASLYPVKKHSTTANLVFLDMFFNLVFDMSLLNGACVPFILVAILFMHLPCI